MSNVHRFKCECLKVAVLKNKWLAQHLGGNQNLSHLSSSTTSFFSGDMFSVVFKYEVPEVVDQELK